ncbi:fungal-specific transcription factor domain-containing protein [Hypoxylon sp. FL1150]|nr:fungal-specific transcription factor domain-containing protein [Hypoxylon sp. FL1150]
MDDEDTLSADGEALQRAKRRRVSRDEDVEGPACQSCRKKKAKCSRKQPCSVCVKYRTASAGSFNRTAKVLGPFIDKQQLWSGLTSDSNIHKDPPRSLNGNTSSLIKGHIEQVKSNLSHLASVRSPRSIPFSEPVSSPRKWHPTSTDGNAAGHGPGAIEYDEAGLPPKDLVDALVEIYFANIHPWIPMLHVRDFRQRMANGRERSRLTTIFHAIVSLCARFSNDVRLGGAEKKAQDAKKSKQTVLLRSMESFSVENLQALIICAFDTLGSGRGPSAWSIIGSMTRTVEQLQLSIEEDDQPATAFGRVLIKRMTFLPPARTWSEREERRRVFWNIFLMDCFCSISTGWNFSLTSADVKIRLPVEGGLWEAGQPLAIPAPYFGVADQTSSANGALPSARSGEDPQDSIGAFAYCIEATESLSLVTSFFLQQTIDFSKVHEVQVWLMKFKTLDLRLIQWKLYLPEQWREACVLNQDGIMDPNLTLAHATHNTAVVLLHQNIAYPTPDWQTNQIRLPSASSSETCLAAATEVALIARKFLQGSTSPTNPQFAFCLFVCGRMLLAHSSYYEIPMLNEFDSLVESLLEMSNRWTHEAVNGTDNLASKFATRLRQAQRQGPGTIDIRQPAYLDDSRLGQDQELDASNSSPAQMGQMLNFNPGFGSASNPMFHRDAQADASPDSITLAFPPLPLAFLPDHLSRVPTAGQSPSLPNIPPSHDPLLRSNNASDINFENSNMVEFEDLNTYLQQQFLPTERISMFSEPMHNQRPG